MNFKFLVDSEVATQEYSIGRMKGFELMMPKIIDCLLQLAYFCGTYKKARGTNSTFNSYCFYQYLQIPYTLRAAWILYRCGYYFEATFSLRYMLEISAKMKYLKKHKSSVQDMWTSKPIYLPTKKGKKRRLSLKDIFDEVSPGSYQSYGVLLSGFHHGGVGSLLFRTVRDSKSIKGIRMGSNWDENTATLVINYLIMFSYIFLNNFPSYFPRGFRKIDKDLLQEYKEIIEWLKGALKVHKNTNKKSRRWYKELAGLLRKA